MPLTQLPQLKRVMLMRKSILFLILSTFALTGCANIPQSSRVQIDDTIATAPDSQLIRVIARPPVKNASPEELVKSFFQACADSSNGYAIARQYLTRSIAQSWDPDAGISVFDETRLSVSNEVGGVIVSAPLVRSANESGHMEIAERSAQLQEFFGLTRNNDGEWRISELRNGVFLAQSDAVRSFRGYPVYFLDKELRTLIPDSILVAQGNAGAATKLMETLLLGPRSMLASVQTSAIPRDTALTFGSVPIVNSVAKVDLTSAVLGASVKARKALAAQIVSTLTSLPSVDRVRITVSGQQLSTPGFPAEMSRADLVDFQPQDASQANVLNVVVGTRGVNADPTQGEKKTWTLSLSDETSIGEVANSLSGAQVAAVSGDAKKLFIANENIRRFKLIARGESLSRPAWDLKKNVYVADYGRGVSRYSANGQSRQVFISYNNVGDESQIRKIAIAPDGVQVALIFTYGSQDFIAAGMLESNNGVSQIIGIHRVEQSIDAVRDIAWLSENQLVVLGRINTAVDQLFTVSTADGSTDAKVVPIGAQHLAVNSRGLVVISVVDGTNEYVITKEIGAWKQIAKGQAPFFTR